MSFAFFFLSETLCFTSSLVINARMAPGKEALEHFSGVWPLYKIMSTKVQSTSGGTEGILKGVSSKLFLFVWSVGSDRTDQCVLMALVRNSVNHCKKRLVDLSSIVPSCRVRKPSAKEMQADILGILILANHCPGPIMVAMTLKSQVNTKNPFISFSSFP